MPLSYIWECPKCGMQLGQSSNPDHAVLGPPTCKSYLHPDKPTEMEQVAAARWMRQYEEGPA